MMTCIQALPIGPMDEQRTRPGSCISVLLAAEFCRLALVQLPCKLTMITGLLGTGRVVNDASRIATTYASETVGQDKHLSRRAALSMPTLHRFSLSLSLSLDLDLDLDLEQQLPLAIVNSVRTSLW